MTTHDPLAPLAPLTALVDQEGLLREAREALASTRYEFNSDYRIAQALVQRIDAALRAAPPAAAETAKPIRAYVLRTRELAEQIRTMESYAPGTEHRQAWMNACRTCASLVDGLADSAFAALPESK